MEVRNERTCANHVVGTLEEKELLERLDTLNTPLVDSLKE